jgi:hypothetical protein
MRKTVAQLVFLPASRVDRLWKQLFQSNLSKIEVY